MDEEYEIWQIGRQQHAVGPQGVGVISEFNEIVAIGLTKELAFQKVEYGQKVVKRVEGNQWEIVEV